MRYAVELTADPESDAILVGVPDLPQVHTFGTDEAEALSMAVDAIETWLDHLIGNDEPIDEPSPIGNQKSVAMSVRTEGKIAVHRALHEAEMTRGNLAYKLGWPLRKVVALLDIYDETDLSDIEVALRALGYEASLDIRPIAA